MALVCQHDGCSMICATGAAMRKHYQKSHIKKGEHLLTKWAVVSAQKLDNNCHQEYFEVNPPSYELEKPINHNWIDNLESNLEEVHSRIALDSPDPQNINPLLKYTQWHKHVTGFDPKKLRSFVSLPDSDEFPMLRETVGWIIHIAMAAIDITPKIILYSLNTKNKQT